MNEVAKKPWQSKTVWINVIMAVVAFFPEKLGVGEILNEGNLLLIASVVNVILRAVTKGKIEF